MATTAVLRVFYTPELLEAILLQLRPSTSTSRKRPENRRTKQNRLYMERHGIHTPPLYLFPLQRVCRQFQATIIGSKALQRELAFRNYTSPVENLPTLEILSFIKGGWGKVSQAWASGKPGSWKTMKFNHPDSKSYALIFSHAGIWYQTDINTTLGMVVEWEFTVRGQQPEPLPVD